jgi:hypothetical protein
MQNINEVTKKTLWATNGGHGRCLFLLIERVKHCEFLYFIYRNLKGEFSRFISICVERKQTIHLFRTLITKYGNHGVLGRTVNAYGHSKILFRLVEYSFQKRIRSGLISSGTAKSCALALREML